MDLNTTRRIPTLVLFYYQGAGKRPAAQERAALGPKGREQLNKPADAARFFFFFFFFFPASTI